MQDRFGGASLRCDLQRVELARRAVHIARLVPDIFEVVVDHAIAEPVDCWQAQVGTICIVSMIVRIIIVDRSLTPAWIEVVPLVRLIKMNLSLGMRLSAGRRGWHRRRWCHLRASFDRRRVNLHADFVDLWWSHLWRLYLIFLLLELYIFDERDVIVASHATILSCDVPWCTSYFLHL